MPSPSVGRIVHYNDYVSPNKCRAAVVTYLMSATQVNLWVFDDGESEHLDPPPHGVFRLVGEGTPGQINRWHWLCEMT